jgi:hypothetical protein
VHVTPRQRRHTVGIVVDAIPVEVVRDALPHGHTRHTPLVAASPAEEEAYYRTRLSPNGRGKVVRHRPVSALLVADDDGVLCPDDSFALPEPQPLPDASYAYGGPSGPPTPRARAASPPASPRRGSRSPPRYQTMSSADKGIALRCVRCLVFGGYIPGVDFRQRVGFTATEARRMYESMTVDASWAHGLAATTPTQMLVHNAMHEMTSGTCAEWGRWFATVSRRRVEEAFQRMTAHAGSMGLMLDRNSRGWLVGLQSPHKRAPPADKATFRA